VRSAISIAQRSPWRYFQRPDADHLELDPDRTSLTGMSGQAQLQYRRGRHWRYSLLAGTTRRSTRSTTSASSTAPTASMARRRLRTLNRDPVPAALLAGQGTLAPNAITRSRPS
jgi:hypothetical protein